MLRALSMRVMGVLALPSPAKRRQVSRIEASARADFGGIGGVVGHRPAALVDRADGLAQVAAAGELHLHGVHACSGAP